MKVKKRMFSSHEQLEFWRAFERFLDSNSLLPHLAHLTCANKVPLSKKNLETTSNYHELISCFYL